LPWHGWRPFSPFGGPEAGFDSDVVAIAVSSFALIHVEEMWISFGTGKNVHHIQIHEIVAALGPSKSRAIGMLHAFTGCDSVSSFSRRGKRRAWETWTSFPEVTGAFLYLTDCPTQISNESLILERFVVLRSV
jgi:hypothetical protein